MLRQNGHAFEEDLRNQKTVERIAVAPGERTAVDNVPQVDAEYCYSEFPDANPAWLS